MHSDLLSDATLARVREHYQQHPGIFQVENSLLRHIEALAAERAIADAARVVDDLMTKGGRFAHYSIMSNEGATAFMKLHEMIDRAARTGLPREG